MSNSHASRLRLRDVREVFRLLADVRDLRGQPLLQRQRAVDGLCQLIGAWHGFCVEFNSFTPEKWVQATRVVTGGAPDSRALRWFAEWAAYNRLNEDPLVNVTTRMNRSIGAVQLRELQAVGLDSSSDIYHGWYEVSGVGDTLVSFFRHATPAVASGIALHRERTESAFNRRDRRMVRMFMAELYRLHQRGELDDGHAQPALAPRQQQVLEQLLRGHSAKQIAAHLGLSQRTVEEYTCGLYEKFGVATRAELMARFLQHQAPPDR